MLNAGAGLLPNPPANIGAAFSLSSNLINAVSSYESIAIVDQFANILSSAANLVTITGTVYDVEVIYGGSAYDSSNPPTPTLLPAPTGIYANTATASATVASNVITAVNMINVGRGYETPPDVFFLGGIGGSGASARAIVKDQPGPLSNETFQDLCTLGANVFPALTNVLPLSYPLGNVFFADPVPAWQPGTVYDTDDVVGQIVLPEFDQEISYVTLDQVTFAEKSYQATANSQGVFPTDTTSWSEINIPPLYYQAGNTSKGVYPASSSLWTASIRPYQLTQVLFDDAQAVMGQGDLSKFCQVFQSAIAYRGQANQTINSCKNSAVLDQTFDNSTGGMDTLTTGGLNQVSNDLTLFAYDTSLLGDLINLANLDDLGLPGELLSQIGRITGGAIADLTDILIARGLSENKVTELSQGINNLTSAEEKTAYSAMLAINGETLKQTLLLLRVRTAGIANMAQLLDPKKIFPNSWQTLLCPTALQLDRVYLANGSANQNIRNTLLNKAVTAYSGPNNTNSLETLEVIIPPDQALANKALARSLGQIKNIAQTSLPQLAAAAALIDTNQGLGLVSSQTQLVPPVVTETYTQDLGSGTGENGTLVLDDIIGVIVDDDAVSGLVQAADLISNLSVSTLSSIYNNMQSVLDGGFGPAYGPIVIPSGPGAGTYSDIDSALQSLIALAESEIANVAAANNETTSTTNQIWDSICEALERQRTNLNLALVDFDNLAANSQSSTMAFTAALHTYGLDSQANILLNTLANTSSLSGQSIIASLREGRNLAAMQTAGLALDTQISDQPS